MTWNRWCSAWRPGERWWTFGDPVEEELDPDLLLWWLHRAMDTAQIAAERFTVFVRLTDHPKRYWIVVEDEPSLCLADPGFEVDVSLRSDRSALYRTYLGHLTMTQALRDGSVELSGSTDKVRVFLASFRQSPVSRIVAAETVERGPG